MDSSSSTILSTQSSNHSYGTRIRHNVSIKPSARLRRSPDPAPRKTKTPDNSKQLHTIAPNPSNTPQLFPPPHVLLHKDDANSKVFLAIARSLLSVDNRATTVKDLADLAVHNGLGCQNSSAATQAITTYLRVHNERCEADHDQPLLLSHNLSGTDADDDLIPALYSLQGGSPRKVSPTRKTNFRKNTAVWYLSRATGAPCPFSRAGIRLCDYVGIGEDGEEKECRKKRSKREDFQMTGQKRKRPLRSCVVKDSSDSESDNSLGNRPPKKLTLRIKPLNCAPTSTASGTRPSDTLSQYIPLDDDSSDDSMSADSSDDEKVDEQEKEEQWRLPPYPRRSISIPCYTPSYDGSYPLYPIHPTHRDSFRRSPSIPYSVGSPPPDSEDEADDFHITMTRVNSFPRDPSSDMDPDSDIDSEGGETQFESPGPRSPSAPLLPVSARVAVKEEPRDVQGMLEAWEDFDSSLPKTADIYAQPVVGISDHFNVKPEILDLWDWDTPRDSSSVEWGFSPLEPTALIKQEDLTFDALFPSTTFTPSSSKSSLSPPSSNLTSNSPSPLDLHIPLHEFEGDWQSSQRQYGTFRPRSKTVPTPAFPTPTPTPLSVLSIPTHNNSIAGTTAESASIQPTMNSISSQSLASLIQSMSSLASGVTSTSLVLPPCVSPHDTRIKGSPTSDVVVVHTCQPCTPPISATQIEDISVYQMMLGPFLLLRRIDTDFVNLTPIVAYTGAPRPILSTIPNATAITKGSPVISGTWVPLFTARAYVKDHPLPNGKLDIFLSDQLYERFPSALQDFHKSNAPGRLLNQFGRHFASTLQASQLQVSTEARRQHQNPQDLVTSSMSLGSDAFALSAALTLAEKQQEDRNASQLSATEQEIFELCVVPDWDKDLNASPTSGYAPEADNMQLDRAEVDVSDTSSLTSLESVSSPSVCFMSMKETEEADAPDPVAERSSTSVTDALRQPPSQSTSSLQHTTLLQVVSMDGPTMEDLPSDRPLRRSKRVADAMAAHSRSGRSSARTGTRRRGSRNSLS